MTVDSKSGQKAKTPKSRQKQALRQFELEADIALVTVVLGLGQRAEELGISPTIGVELLVDTIHALADAVDAASIEPEKSMAVN